MRLHWKEFLIAFVMAVALWYALSGTERMEAQVDVRVEYKGIPKDMVIRGNGLINKVTVRISGPAGQMRALTTREHLMVIDLASLQKGENVIPIDPSQAHFFGAIQVIDITPSVLVLDADVIESKVVPLTPEIIGAVPKGYEATAALTPEAITVRGPSRDLAAVTSVAVPLQISEPSGPATLEFQNRVALPGTLEADSPVVAGTVVIDYKRKRAAVQREVTVTAPERFGVFIRPARVGITLALPEALVSGALQNREIQAFVTPPEPKLGTVMLPVRVSLPEGAQLVRIDPAEVAVTLEQKP